MPVKSGKDNKGSFMRWGSSGKKYYYKAKDKASRDRAKAKATKQGQFTPADLENRRTE